MVGAVFKSVPTRIAGALVTLVASSRGPSNEGVQIKLTHVQLAAALRHPLAYMPRIPGASSGFDSVAIRAPSLALAASGVYENAVDI